MSTEQNRTEQNRITITNRGSKLPILETNRLILRDIEIGDISNEYIEWLNNPDVTKYLEIRFFTQSKEEVRKYVTSKLQDTVNTKHFGVYDQNGKRLIGTVTLPNINHHHSFADISFVIGHKDTQGKGYATEAVHAVVHYMFTECGISKLWGGYYDGHIGSAKVLEKNGFKVEGVIKKKLINYEGKRVDGIIVGLLSEDYLKNTAT